jgi:hypothetical protein
MAPECAYSFRDLFFAAHQREMTTAEKHTFMSLPQTSINKFVKELAALAGWKTQDRKGTDGKTYTAFCPAVVE